MSCQGRPGAQYEGSRATPIAQASSIPASSGQGTGTEPPQTQRHASTQTQDHQRYPRAYEVRCTHSEVSSHLVREHQLDIRRAADMRRVNSARLYHSYDMDARHASQADLLPRHQSVFRELSRSLEQSLENASQQHVLRRDNIRQRVRDGRLCHGCGQVFFSLLEQQTTRLQYTLTNDVLAERCTAMALYLTLLKSVYETPSGTRRPRAPASDNGHIQAGLSPESTNMPSPTAPPTVHPTFPTETLIAFRTTHHPGNPDAPTEARDFIEIHNAVDIMQIEEVQNITIHLARELAIGVLTGMISDAALNEGLTPIEWRRISRQLVTRFLGEQGVDLSDLPAALDDDDEQGWSDLGTFFGVDRLGLRGEGEGRTGDESATMVGESHR